MNMTDIDRLESDYHLARSALAAVTHVAGYPVYPKPISDFMLSLCRPPWGRNDYDPRRTTCLLQHLDEADEDDLCRVLTALSRAERFSDGFWISYLEDDLFIRIIARARVLISSPRPG